ncbi:putative quinol monooxygenase [Clostridium arbusti]|uniref:putative quinol monooxygenase n=1 Tax=Clostridium arbusti TaxID=1137848 RepID=UPI000289C937|nr:putative quinol monooxygenase [Clostridium arbusti]
MITITAKSIVKQDKIDEFINLAKELVKKSVKESGCISYNLYQNINYENMFTVIEEWESKKAIKSHNDSDHFKSIVPELEKLREKNADVNLYKKVQL